MYNIFGDNGSYENVDSESSTKQNIPGKHTNHFITKWIILLRSYPLCWRTITNRIFVYACVYMHEVGGNVLLIIICRQFTFYPGSKQMPAFCCNNFKNINENSYFYFYIFPNAFYCKSF